MQYRFSKQLEILIQHGFKPNEMLLLKHIGEAGPQIERTPLSIIQIESKIAYASFYRALRKLQELSIVEVVSADNDTRVKHLRRNHQKFTELVGKET